MVELTEINRKTSGCESCDGVSGQSLRTDCFFHVAVIVLQQRGIFYSRCCLVRKSEL
jgi:hypothetical protein